MCAGDVAGFDGFLTNGRDMTVAFDVFSNPTAGTGDLSWSHNPVGTPRGILVWVVANVSTEDNVTGVTYDGDALTEVSGSPNIHATGETGGVYCFFRGVSVSTADPATVVMTSGLSGIVRQAGAVTLTAADDLEIVDVDATINGDTEVNPSVVLSLSSRTSFAGIGFHSGRQGPANITPLTNWTDQEEFDFGAQVAGFYTFDTIGSSDVTAGWTQGSDDATAIAIAISEPVPVGGGGRLLLINPPGLDGGFGSGLSQ